MADGAHEGLRSWSDEASLVLSEVSSQATRENEKVSRGRKATACRNESFEQEKGDGTGGETVRPEMASPLARN